jgi:hypothetical protein
MAGKHYIIATQSGYLVDEVTGYPYEFHSKEAAVKALAEEVKTAARECRRSHKSCSVVGSARKGSVQIKVGGRQGYHLWQRYVINERPGARKPPREARETEIHHATRKDHATKKPPAQLDAEIAEILAGPLLNPATSSGVVTRNYEYVVYPEASHRYAERAVKVPQRRGRGPYDLGGAKLVAKQMGTPAAIYSVSKGRFVGYVHPSGRYVTFR